jgi:hypothetical protein
MVCSDRLYNERNDMLMPINDVGFTNPELTMPDAPAPSVLPETSFEDDRAIVMGLMRASELTLAPLIEKEADIYKVEDLKIRFR